MAYKGFIASKKSGLIEEVSEENIFLVEKPVQKHIAEIYPRDIERWDSCIQIGTENYIPKWGPLAKLEDSIILQLLNSILIGTANAVPGHKVRISGGALNITNWPDEGQYDKLSIDFGEFRGIGYDPTPNEIFIKGTSTVPVKIDTDAPTDSFNIKQTGTVQMSNLTIGTGEVLLLNAQNELVRNQIIPILSSTATVKFDQVGGYIHGNAGAITGNITFDFANEILGSTAFMLHNSSTPPTFPTEAKIISGAYQTSTDNYIWFCLTKTTTGRVVQVTIGQV